MKKEGCKALYTLPNGEIGAYGCSTFHCIREVGHEGEHFDHYGWWQKNGRKYEVVPLSQAHRELNICAS